MALYHLKRNTAALLRPVQEGAAVATIDPAVPQPGESPAVQPPQQRHGAVAVADIGGRHLDLADQPEGVDQQVALAAVELLGAVVAVAPPRSVVLTLWLSKIAALGVGARPCRTRSWICSSRWICSHSPCCRQLRK
jgi:hypothetical protein